MSSRKSLFVNICVLLVTIASAINQCQQREIKAADVSIVCVCNSTFCDEIEPLRSLVNGQAAVYLSSKEGKRLQKELKYFENVKPPVSDPITIKIDPSIQYQTILGFGGAFTDAVGINLNKLEEKTRETLIQQYFGIKGIGYTLGRVPIGSCDFSARQYSYAEEEDDFQLDSFNLTNEDFNLKFPYLKRAQSLEEGLRLFGSPWSPPAWMKSSGEMVGGGTLKGEINGEYYKAYAKYLLRFFEEYSKNGIKFWGMTTQNEPHSGLIPFFPWQTMYLSGYEQQQFIKNHLGPAIRKSPITKDMKIMVNDDNLFVLPAYTDKIFEDKEAADYVDGIGIHWYLTDFSDRNRLLKQHEHQPNKFILSTEASNGADLFDKGPRLGMWDRANRYIRDIMGGLHRWVVGWTDWNMCLDEQGGPNWAKNFVDSAIIVNVTANEFYKQPMFYAIAHFSKFIPPNSIRIQSSVSDLPYGSRFDAIAFVTPTNNRVVVAHNAHYDRTYQITIKDPNQVGFLNYKLPPSSIATFIWKKLA